jgi:hypothetical protein
LLTVNPVAVEPVSNTVMLLDPDVVPASIT